MTLRTLIIKPANKKQIDLTDVDDSILTIGQLKNTLSGLVSIPKEQIRLVCKGKILREDEFTLAQYGVEDGGTINLVKLAANSTLPVSPTGESGSGIKPLGAASGATAPKPSNGLNQLLTSLPWMEQLMSTPGFMEQLLQTDPRFRQLAESNPDVASALQNPSMLQDMIRTMRDPNARAQMEQSADRMLAQIESGAIPGAYQQLSSMLHSIASTDDALRETQTPEQEQAREQAFAARLGVQPRNQTAGPNTEALPNPWAPATPTNATGNLFGNLFGPSAVGPAGASAFPFFPVNAASPAQSGASSQQLLQDLMQLSSSQAFTQQAPANDAAPSAEERYASELEQLSGMGFSDRQANLRALRASGGRIESAIEYLLNQSNV